MNFVTMRNAVCILSLACGLQAATPDISNLKNCIADVRRAENSPPVVPTFDSYTTNYDQLLADLRARMATLPHVYVEAAANPLIQFLEDLGEVKFLQIFNGNPSDELEAVLQQMIPDAALSILYHEGIFDTGVNAFQEIVSDLYDSFLSEGARVSRTNPIEPPTYGTIPPLVKFGNAEFGPYTWPCNSTSQILGMKCAIVSLPPAQLKGGLLAWTTLGHETGGHDVTHADEGLLDELAQNVYNAVLRKFKSRSLANYWANCIDESVADVLGYLNMGPSTGIGLIGYFRGLGDGTLRSIGSLSDPHPIDLLRGYLAAAAVKRLHFKDAEVWSQIIARETSKDNATLYLVDDNGNYYRFPVPFEQAIASTEVVAQTIMQSKLVALQGHSLQKIQDWTDQDQEIVNNLVPIIKANGELPSKLRGPKFYASYVVASAAQAALERSADISTIFKGMQNFLAAMHLENPTWSQTPTEESIALLDKANVNPKKDGKFAPHLAFPKFPPVYNLMVGQL